MRHILFCAITLLVVSMSVVFADPRTVSWQVVTTYTDGTNIEQTKTIYYDIIRHTQGGADNTLIVNGVTNSSAVFEQANDGKTYIFNGRARLDTGEESAWGPDCLWTAPPPSSLPSVPAQPIILQIRRP